MIKNRRTKQLFRLAGALLIMVALLFALGIALYLMLTYAPESYRPHTLTKAQQDQVQDYVLEKTQQMYNNVNIMQPFAISFDQQRLNDLLMLAEQTRLFKKISVQGADKVRHLQLSFQPGTVNLMGQTTYKNVTTVVTVSLRPKITEQGKLQVTLRRVKAGALVLPDRLVRRQLARLAETLQAVRDYQSIQIHKKRNSGEKQQLLAKLLDNLLPVLQQLPRQRQVTVDAVFRADEDKRARITHLTVGEGKVELQIQPELIGLP